MAPMGTDVHIVMLMDGGIPTIISVNVDPDRAKLDFLDECYEHDLADSIDNNYGDPVAFRDGTDIEVRLFIDIPVQGA